MWHDYSKLGATCTCLVGEVSVISYPTCTPGIIAKYTVPSKTCQTSTVIPLVDIPSYQALLSFVEGFPFSFEIPVAAYLVKKQS